MKKMVDCDVEMCERDTVRGPLRQLLYSNSAEEYETQSAEEYEDTNG